MDICINCGKNASVRYRGCWYCSDCYIDIFGVDKLQLKDLKCKECKECCPKSCKYNIDPPRINQNKEMSKINYNTRVVRQNCNKTD